jgi:phosphoribosylaminoimidazolecarboxamide formyltransferase / IMP cyclohydrolase
MMMKRALISVSDKTNVVKLANSLIKNDYQIVSTGGTARLLRDNKIRVTSVSDLTGYPEILGGRVKTLNPAIAGGILNRPNVADDNKDMIVNKIPNIDVVVANLYPFRNTILKHLEINSGAGISASENDIIENIDIGGITLLRSAAKNYKHKFILSDPTQYLMFEDLLENLNTDSNEFYASDLLGYRKKLAQEAFKITTEYDRDINNWFQNSHYNPNNTVFIQYTKQTNLKYGCNPHQTKASLLTTGTAGTTGTTSDDKLLPFRVLNGQTGYINVLDALNSWQLVNEIDYSIGYPAAASFKHVSPAGVGMDSNSILEAYKKARNSDPRSSFGDFIAVNRKVTVELANYIKTNVSDGIIAPDYEEEALKILSSKKNGSYAVLRMNNRHIPSGMEYRNITPNVVLGQEKNDKIYTYNDIQNVATGLDAPVSIKDDMIMSLITLKYTQSNSVGFAYKGQMIGIGAGQQSRIDCVKLAKQKAIIWLLRNNPEIQNRLVFKRDSEGKLPKKVTRTNAIIAYIENDFSDVEKENWKELFETVPQDFDQSEFDEYLKTQEDIILSSDGFFPFRDNIDKASTIGTQYVVQPGGSNGDKSVIEGCNDYDMTMVFTGSRLFHH